MHCVGLAAGLTACGESLTLPGDGGPAALTAVSGNPQEGTAGKRLDDPLVVRVTDAGSNPLAGVPIVFRFQGEIPGAEIDPGEAVTDAEGHASAQVRLGDTTGSQNVEAQVAQASSSNLRTTFDLTAVDGNNGKKGGKGGDNDENDDDDEHDDDD
jgi:hypothetical protein